MVEGLSKRITGDWVEIGQAGLSVNGLCEYFAFGPEALDAIGEKLSSSVEQGIVEFKEGVLRPLFGVLEDMKYKTIGFDLLAEHLQETGRLLFVTLIQRLFASGGIAPEDEGAVAGSAGAETDLKLVLADVMARVRQEPALKNNTAVKLILTQLAIYQRERETMEKLLPNIKDGEKAVAFRRNFSNTFQKITLNIRKYYREFLEEEQRRTKKEHRLSLARLPLKDLLPLFTRQAREFLRIRSTLAFALEGKYKVREICVHLFNEKQSFLSLLDEELVAYRKIVQGLGEGQGRNLDQEVSHAFVSEIIALIGKDVPREREA